MAGEASIIGQGAVNSAAVEADALPAGRWRALAVMAGAVLLSMTTWFSASAVVPQVRAAWGLTTNQSSLLTIAVQLGFVIGAVLSAALTLADVFPPKWVFCVAAIGAAAVNAGIVLAHGPGLAIPLRFATGFFLAGVYPVGLKLLATWFRRGRGMALGVMVGALTLGSALPHFINGIGGLHWRAVILATSILTVTGALLAALTMHDGPFPFSRAPFDPQQIRQVFTNRGVRLASLGYFGHMWELYAMWAWFLAFATDSLTARGTTNPRRSAALTTFAVIGIGAVGCWLGGILGDRWGRTRTTAAAMALSAACALGIGFVFGAPFPLVVAVGLIWGVAVVADSAQFSTVVTELADQSYVGTALTLQLAVGFTLTVVTIWLVPILHDHVGWRWTFAFLAPGPLGGLLVMLHLRRLPESAHIAHGRG
ncbi:MAG: MFS transporter [Thermomicrobia bacterium]|nr:MFS transporter [Thermomicrobia bacterium]